MRMQNKEFSFDLTDLLTILSFVVGISLAYASLNAKVEAMDGRITELAPAPIQLAELRAQVHDVQDEQHQMHKQLDLLTSEMLHRRASLSR